jgi:hypothetical protein
MAKNKQNSKNYLSIFFEEAKISAPKVSPVFKARILKDAHKTWGGGDAIQDSPRLDATLLCLKELSGFPSVLGFGASLTVGFYIGFYSPDWTQPLASFFQINTFDEVDFTGLFFGMNEIF